MCTLSKAMTPRPRRPSTMRLYYGSRTTVTSWEVSHQRNVSRLRIADQLSVPNAKAKFRGVPYADFALWTSRNSKIPRAPTFKTCAPQADGTFLAKELEGGANPFGDQRETSAYWANRIKQRYPGSIWAGLIDNPDYKDDPTIGQYSDFGVLAFEIWQVKSGTIFDSIIITDDEEEAKAFGESSFTALVEAEKKAKDVMEEEKKKAEAEAEAEDTDDDEDDDEDEEPKDEL